MSFLLHPAGLSALLVISTVSLGLLFAETGALMVIGFGSIEQQRVTWIEAVRYSFNRVAGLVHIAWIAVVRLLVISLPFLAAVGALYWLLLRRYDINYYLTQKPPEFQTAILVAGVRKTAALRPDWTYGLLSAVGIGDLTRLDVDFLALTAAAASPSTIRRAHQRGMKVYAWTIDDPVQMSVMMSRGVDGIITDQVARACQVKPTRAELGLSDRLET